MRTTLFALAAVIGLASAAPAFADSMQRDGDHSGRLGSPSVLYPAPYGQVYTGRSVAIEHAPVVRAHRLSDTELQVR